MNITIDTNNFLSKITNSDLAELIYTNYIKYYKDDFETEEDYLNLISKLFYLSKFKEIIFKNSFINKLKQSYYNHNNIDVSHLYSEKDFNEEEIHILNKINFIEKDMSLTEKGYTILNATFSISEYLDFDMNAENNLKELIFKLYLSSN